MRILWHSNAPFVGSGYANQTDIVARWLQNCGHEVIVSAFHGLREKALNYGGVTVLPGSAEQWGNDVLASHFQHYLPDVTFLLMDAWVVSPQVLQKVPAAIWTPVDSTPIPPPVADNLKLTRWPVAMSRHGEREMRKEGLDPFYVPHMVETDVFRPMDRDEARAAFGVKAGRFFAATVAANKGFPSRKSLDKLLYAWALFLQEQPGGLLYIHSYPYPQAASGLDLLAVAEFYGLRTHLGSLKPGETLDGVDVAFPDVYRMIRGDYGATALNHLYNAADVFVLPSMGEGFGIPVIEAQAAGCPVVVTDWTALHELGEVGYRIPIDPVDDVVFTLQDSHQCSPKVSRIVNGLKWAHGRQGDTALRETARQFARGYDVEVVMNRHMLPALQTMAQGDADMLAMMRKAA